MLSANIGKQICEFSYTHRKIVPTKDTPKEKEKKGVYQKRCENCDLFYCGQTSKYIDIRFRKHKVYTKIRNN